MTSVDGRRVGNNQTRLDLTIKLEQPQYSAALAVQGTWRGTSRQRLYKVGTGKICIADGDMEGYVTFTNKVHAISWLPVFLNSM